MKPIRLAVFVFAVLVGSHPLAAQAPATSSAPGDPQQPVFRAGVELVRLDIRVVDDRGLPIKDLKPEEISVEEGGQRRPIVLFQHVSAPSGSYLEVARRTIGAEVSTNQGAPRGSLYVFVFDQSHIAAGNEQRARRAVERFLQSRVRPGDRVALFAIPGPGPQIALTSNVTLALGELPKVRGQLERNQGIGVAPMNQYEAYQIARGDHLMLQRVLTRSSESLDLAGRSTRNASSTSAPGTSPATGDSFAQASLIVTDAARSIVATADGESRVFLNALSDVIRQLAPIEGRKAVVLVSEGFYADNVSHEVDGVAAAAAEAYAVVYSLEINRRDSDLTVATPVGGDQAAETLGRTESLGALSAETSGELIADAAGQGDAALNRIADTSQDFYVVGFEPPADALTGRHLYRRVKVRVSRPGARVTTRTGYAVGDPMGPADRRRSIDRALAAPFPQQGLPLEMTTYVLHGDSPGSQRVFLSLQAELPVAADAAARGADVVFVARNARDGRVAASGSDTLPLPRAAAAGKTTAPAVFQVQFDLPAGEYLMRAAVREPGGATGTVDRRFEVRALDGVDVTASDLIVGRRQDRLPVRPVAFLEEGLAGALEVYARNPDDLRATEVHVDLFRLDGDSPVRSTRAELGATRAIRGGGVRGARLELPLTDVTPGDYVVRATVRAHGEAVTELMRQVQILPGRAPASPPSPAENAVTPAMIVGGALGQRFVAALGQGASDQSLARAVERAALGDWNAALSLLGAADDRQPPRTHALRGLALFALGRIDPARGSLERAWALDDTSPLLAFFLGWVRSAAAQTSDAISAWRAAVALDPTLVSAYLALAEAYLKLAHPELAVQALQEGLRRVPGSPELSMRLSDIQGR